MKKKETYSKSSMLMHFLYGCKRFFIFTVLASFLVSLLEMLIPQVIRQTVDAVIGEGALKAPSFIVQLFEKLGGAAFFRTHLIWIAGLIIILAVLLALMIYLRGLTASVSAEKLQQNIREDLFSHIQKLPFAWHMQNKTGDIIQRCTSDAERVRTFVSEQMISIIRIVIMVAMSLFFMFSMNVKLTLIASAFVPVVVIYSMIFHRKISQDFEKCDENEGVLSTIAQENLTGVRVVRAFGREEFERERFEKQNVYYTGLWVRLMKLLSYFWGASDFIGGIQILLMLTLGSVFAVRGELTAGEFIAFLSYNGMLIWPVRQLGRVISEMSKAGVSIDRIRYIMNSSAEEDKPDAVETAVTEEALHGDIVFDHVNFGYDEGTEILHDISFRVKAGQTLGILGSTGSGKSTLMHLLNRLYPLGPENGKISIGGVDIADMKAEDLRAGIGMVLQEPFLFSRTIGENIGFTDRKMTMEEIRSAAKIACVDEAITEFSKGYDTMVGERGVTLSGGQKQRTAIARMLTQKAPIMIFDDSLSAVDAETDAKIRAQLRETLGSSTVILISHRVTTLMQADQVIVMDKGRIVETGTPEELKTAGGMYQKIYDIQLSFSEVG
ncbi:MAG: ABC transporter ATP-binding protein [Lachnospiraceae bacterium]|nr:ABC transporter ATP-binding protein [Lachnospiraceae bacterium]